MSISRLFLRPAVLVLALASLLPALSTPSRASSADQLFAENKFQQAATAYAGEARNAPHQVAPRLGEVRALMRLDKWTDAVAAGRVAVAAGPNSADAHGLLSLALMRAGLPDKAEAEAQRAIVLSSQSYWALTAMGRLYIWQGKKADANKTLTKAVQLHPDWPDAYYYLFQTFEDNERAKYRKVFSAYARLAPRGFPHDRVRQAMKSSESTKEDADKSDIPRPDIVTGGKEKSKGAKPKDEKAKDDKAKDATTKDDKGKGEKPKDEKAKAEKPAEDKGKEAGVKPAPETPSTEGPDMTPVVVPFQRDERNFNFIVLPVNIDGETFHMLLDTGAGQSITLGSDAMQRIDPVKVGKRLSLGVNGTEVGTMYRGKKMSIGSLSFSDVPFEGSSNPIRPVDGLPGGAVLQDFAVTFDFENKTMTLTRGKRSGPPAAASGSRLVTIPFHNEGGYIFVPIKIEDSEQTEWAFVDSGWSGLGSLSLREARTLARKRPDSSSEELEIEGRFGVGNSVGKTKVRVFSFGVEINMNNNGGSKFFIAMSPIYGLNSLDDLVNPSFNFELRAAIGIDYLASAKRVTIDYPRSLLTLEIADNSAPAQ